MGTLLKDIRFGFRMLIKNPGLAVISVIALTLGIGLTTTMFSIVYGAVIRGLPFEESAELLHIERSNLPEDIESMGVSIHDYTDWRSQQASFEDLAAFYQGTVNVAGIEGRPDRYDGAFITPSAFPMLGVQPLLGRTFLEEEKDPGAAPAILLGYRVWQDRFEGDPAAVGRTLRANGETMTIVGVMPEGFRFPVDEDVWLPLRMNPLEIDRNEGIWLEVFGRLKDGVTADVAAVELIGLAQRLAIEYPETNEGVSTLVQPYVNEFIGDDAVAMLFTMLAAVFGVLLIACANVANLLLARAAVRTKEVAIRSAMGASRMRVISQLLTEALALSLVGALLGLGLAFIGVMLFNNSIVDVNPPFWIDIKIDPAVLTFVLGLTFLSSLFAGVFPAIQASGADVNSILKDEARGSSSLRLGKFSKGLVITEIALSCGLLVGAGLMIKSVVNLKTTDFGFQHEEIFTARVGLFETDYPTVESRQQFWEELVRRLGAKPGVVSAALTSNLPTNGSNDPNFAIEGEAYATDRHYPEARQATITPDFFETFGVNVLQGRSFAVSDIEDALPVVIVNQSFVRSFFPNGDVLGKRIRLGRSDSEEPWMTVVGVAPDMWMRGIDDTAHEPGMYTPLAQEDFRFLSIAVRTAGPPMAITQTVRDEVMAIDQNLPIYWVYSMSRVLQNNSWFYGVFGTLFMVFGFAALFMATVGLYGVMSFTVSRRTQEMGLRMALGAQARDVVRLIFRSGMMQLGIGLTLGVALAAGLSKGLAIVLFEVEPWDPAIFGIIVLSMIVTGLLACLVPAKRATRVDPMVALRYE